MSDNNGGNAPALALAPAQLIMSTATLTKAVRALLQDVQGDKGSGFLIDYNDPTNLTPKVMETTNTSYTYIHTHTHTHIHTHTHTYTHTHTLSVNAPCQHTLSTPTL